MSGQDMSGQDMSGQSANERAATLVSFLSDAAARIEDAGELPADVMERMHEARLFRILLPKSLGGDELHLSAFADVIETLAMGDASTAWVASQGAGCAMASAYLQPEAGQRLFGPSNAVLAWGAGIQGRAVEAEGGYRLTGTWTFASGSRHATMLGGHSFIFAADGAQRMRADGRPLDRTLLFPREQAEMSDIWNVMGLRGTGSDSFMVTDLFVPIADTIDREAPSERAEDGVLYNFAATLVYGIGFAALQLGIARTMVNGLRDLAKTKTPRGAPSTLQQSQLFQSQLARMEGRLRGARAYLHAAINELWEAGAAHDTLTLAERGSIKLASVHVIHEAVAVTEDAYRTAGSTAIFTENPFERRFRDALSASQQTQARAQNFVTIGQILLDLEPDSLAFL